MKNAWRLSGPLLAIALLGCSAEPQLAATQAAVAESRLARIPLEIATGEATHSFNVEVAASQEEQSRGLMFREWLGGNEGMLFPFSSPRPASFWMKNTLIPLDMIFIRPDGTIARIAANTVPHSLEPVSVSEPVAAVLEIAGGRAAQLGIAEGDRVSWQGMPRS